MIGATEILCQPSQAVIDGSGYQDDVSTELLTHDLVCLDCGERYEVRALGAVPDELKVCPACGSTHARETFESFLRNGRATFRPYDPEVDCGFG